MQDSANEIVMRTEEEMAKNAICEWERKPQSKVTPEPFWLMGEKHMNFITKLADMLKLGFS